MACRGYIYRNRVTVANVSNTQLEMWANAQRDGHPAEHSE